ncbi:homoserine kinase [Candidatus Micrarchaeota archaeon]|nr:homoserine kinase [Candidatus Micrarchaeota archaeon]
MDSIRLSAPATSANLGAGFDVCGLALEEPFDEFAFFKSPVWTVKNSGKYAAAEDSKQSVFGFVWNAMRKEFGLEGSLAIDAFKSVKPRAGMGASACEAASTAFAVNELFSLGLTKEQLVYWAGFGEAFAANEPHYDNVSPCVFGGMTITYSTNPVKVKRLEAPQDLQCLLVISDRDKASTAFARSVLPDMIERWKAVKNSFYLSRLLVGFFDSDTDVIISSFGDEIVEPARARSGNLPNFLEFKRLGREYGFGTAASGAGPTLVAFGKEKNEKFSKAVWDSFARKNIKTELVWTRVSSEGVHEI